jgi:hypothetical protein
MRVMVLLNAPEASEQGQLPSADELNEMGRYNAELVEAGIMLAGEGLAPTHTGKKIVFANGETTVVDGPFAEAKEMIGGFWLWEVSSMEEALEWARRAPFRNETLVVRRVLEAEDFGEQFTDEMREREEKLRQGIEAQHG